MNMQQKLTLWEAEQHIPENVIPFPSVQMEVDAASQIFIKELKEFCEKLEHPVFS